MKRANAWYSVIVALLMVGFLLVLTAGVFHLVLSELQDNKGRANYIKAYYGAQWGIEWALLKIKNVGYGVVDEVSPNVNSRSIVLSQNPKTPSLFKSARDVMVSFTIDTKTESFTGTLESGQHEIIPLYYITASGSQIDVDSLSLSAPANADALSWNIIGSQFWLAWAGNFTKDTQGDYKFIETLTGESQFKFAKKTVQEFLADSDNNYLIIFNAHPTDPVQYTVSSQGGKYFTKPVWDIYASGYVWPYKQNIKVSLDNTAYLSILKYSIFSN